MKCVDCGAEIELKKVAKELKVTLSNPGNISAVRNVHECGNCSQHYAEEDEALRLMETFENERIKKNY